MKVKRYPAGQTNVALLREGRANIMSPQFAAAAEYSKYSAMAEGANAAGMATAEIFQINEERKLKADATQSALDVDNYQAAYEKMVREAEEQNWTDDQFRANAEALNRTLMDSTKMISERNRKKVEDSYRNIVGQMGLQTDEVAYKLRRKQQMEKLNARYQEAMAERDFISLKYLDDLALSNRWIDKAEYEKRQRSHEEMQRIGEMVDEYKNLTGEQQIADFMSGIPDSGLSEEGQRTLVSDIGFYEKTQAAQRAIFEEQEREAQERLYVDIGQSIQFAPIENQDDLMKYAETYSDANLHAIADEMDLSLALREKLFKRRNDRLKEIASKGNKGDGGDIEPDLTSKSYRDSITTEAAYRFGIDPETATPEQRDQVVAYETEMAGEYGAIGTTTTNFLNNSATGGARGEEGGWEQFLSALPVYNKLASTDNVVWDGVDAKNIAMYESVRYMNLQQNPDLARQVWVNYRSASQQELDRAQAQYNFDDLMEEIMDREDIAGSAGLVRPDVFLWFNEEPEIPGATKALIRNIGETLAIHEALTNGTVNYRQLAEKTANVMGTMLTSSKLNEGVPVGNDGMKRVDTEAMAFAPVKPEGEAWAREVLAQDFLGMDYAKEKGGKFYWNEDGERVRAGRKVKAFNQEMTIVPPLDFTEQREIDPTTEMTLPDPYFDVEEGIIPVNWIRIVTPPLAQDQFDDKGQRVWHLYYRGKPLLNTDNTYIEWTPFLDPETGAARVMEENANQ